MLENLTAIGQQLSKSVIQIMRTKRNRKRQHMEAYSFGITNFRPSEDDFEIFFCGELERFPRRRLELSMQCSPETEIWADSKSEELCLQ